MDINVMVIWGFSDLLELFIFPGNHDYKAHIFIDFKKNKNRVHKFEIMLDCLSPTWGQKCCWIFYNVF